MNIKKLTRKLYPDATRSNRKEINAWFKHMQGFAKDGGRLHITNSPVYPTGCNIRKIADNNFRILP